MLMLLSSGGQPAVPIGAAIENGVVGAAGAAAGAGAAAVCGVAVPPDAPTGIVGMVSGRGREDVPPLWLMDDPSAM